MKLRAIHLLPLLPLALIGCEKSELHFTAPGISINSSGGRFHASGDFSKMDQRITATGPITTETRTVSEFHSIYANSLVNVEFVKSDQTSVNISAKKDILNKVTATVTDGALQLGLEGNIDDAGPITIKVSGPNLDALSASGSSHIDCTGSFQNPIKVSVDGASKVDLNGSATKLDLSISGSSILNATSLATSSISGSVDGSSQAKLAGTITDVDLTVSGSGNVHVDGIEARDCQFKLDGAAVLEARGITNKLNINASGSSTANLPSLVSQECEAQADGGSQVHVNAVKSLKAVGSGGSQIGYTGKPTTLSPTTDGGATIKND